MPTTVFISYSSADRVEALEVRRLLVARGCAVWLDVFDIRVAADLKSELGGGIERADVLCLLLSPTAVASPWVAEEIRRGEAEAATRGLRMVVVLLRPCRPPDALLGRVLLDATSGIASPDVRARLERAVLGAAVVGDMEIDAAMQQTMQARQHEMEAALVLPELATQLDPLRETPIRALRVSFRPEALPRGAVLAVSLTFDTLFAQPMWFLFSHYREGHTWPRWMKAIRERDHREIRSDGKRIDGRFQWFDHVRTLDPHLDGTDLRDMPATFDVEFDGADWQPGGSIATYAGGPTVSHLKQTMEVPSLAQLIAKSAAFGVALLGRSEGEQTTVVLEETDLDVQVVATIGDGSVTLFRSGHSPIERAVMRGAYLQRRASAIEREAILGLYQRPRDLANDERQRRRRDAVALLEKDETLLSPDERRVVGLLHYGRARLEMFRVFGSAPPPGPAREALHVRALNECMAVGRVLGPIAAQEPNVDDVGMTYWATSTLAHYFLKGKAPQRAQPYAETAVEFTREAVRRDPDEPEYRRWLASAHSRLADVRAAIGDIESAVREFDASLAILRELAVALPNEGRKRDLRDGLSAALRSSVRWGDAAMDVRSRWEASLNAIQ